MAYLLDTNTIVRYLNGRAPNVRVRLSMVPLAELGVSAIVVAELRYGAAKSLNPAKVLAAQDQLLSLIDTIPFDQAAADAYGPIRATLEQQGRPIGANDRKTTRRKPLGFSPRRRGGGGGGLPANPL